MSASPADTPAPHAAGFAGENPFGISPDAELLAVPPAGAELWNESMFFQFTDTKNEFALRTHTGTYYADTSLWRGLFIFYLPGGEELLVSRSFGRSTDNRGPDGGLVKYKLMEPLKRWQVTFDGAVERVTRLEAARGTVGAGLTEPMKLSLIFEATTPVWDQFAFAGIAEQSWGHLHHQQAFNVAGEATIGGQLITLSGYGYRDHSRGGRDLSGYGGNQFLNIRFPSGKVIQGIQAEDRAGNFAFRTGYLYLDGVYHRLEVVDLPRLEDTSGTPDAFTARWRLGEEEIAVSGRAYHHGPMTIYQPHDRCLGVNLKLDDPLVIVESPVRAEWNGEVGFGMLERNQRLSSLRVA
jgi:hypothetical protein